MWSQANYRTGYQALLGGQADWTFVQQDTHHENVDRKREWYVLLVF